MAINYTGTDNRTEFTYDGLNHCKKIVEKSSGAVIGTKQFVWLGNRIAEERDASNAVARRYFGQGEQRLGGADAGVYYYSKDHLGSIRELTDAAGSLRARYEYDPFGNTSKVSGDLTLDFGYTGHYRHTASNLYLAPFRAYDPTIGRWINRDPIGEEGGLNLYGYVLNNPCNDIDPLGLQEAQPGPAPTPTQLPLTDFAVVATQIREWYGSAAAWAGVDHVDITYKGAVVYVGAYGEAARMGERYRSSSSTPLRKKDSGELLYGNKKPCKCATDDDIIGCLKGKPPTPGVNCQGDVAVAIASCCLTGWNTIVSAVFPSVSK